MKKWLRISIVVLSCVFLIGFIAAWNILPHMILTPYRYKIAEHNADLPQGSRPEDFGLVKDDFDIETLDSLHLDAWFIHAQGEAKASIIMIHGIGACKEVFLRTAKKFASHNYNVVLFDLRAHGQSEGDQCTYGFNEKNDIRQITDSLLQKNSSLPIGLYGASLGGAIAYQALAADHRLKFGVIECTFDDLRNVVREYTARYIGFHCAMIADFGLWRAQSLGQFNADDVVPVHCAAQIDVPVFVAHGNKDIHIPIEFGKRNFDALKNPGKVFYEVDGADHNGIHKKGGTAYMDSLIHFMDLQTNGLKME